MARSKNALAATPISGVPFQMTHQMTDLPDSQTTILGRSVPDAPAPETSRREAREQDDAPPRGRRFSRTGLIAFVLSAIAVAGVGLPVLQMFSSTPQSTLESVGAMAGRNQKTAAPTSPATSATTPVKAAPRAVPARKRAPKNLGTVSGVYRLRGPATAAPGSWAMFVLAGPKRVIRSDVSAPFSVPVNTRKLPNGSYTLTVVVMRAGAAAKVATRLLTVRNVTKPVKTAPKPAPGTGTGSGGGPTSGAGSATAAEVVTLTNAERAKSGCPALTVNAKLTTAAQAHSTDMATNNYFSHDSQDGRSPFDRMKAAGYDYRMAAENIAMGQQTPQDVMTAWMNSEGHKANILNCGLTEIGVGYALNASGTPYWTQDFGTPA